MTGRTIFYGKLHWAFHQILFLPYLDNIIHDGHLSDHITNILKTPIFFCPWALALYIQLSI